MDLAVEFPGLRRATYLNSCAHGLLPARTRRAMDAHMDRWEGAPDWVAWMEAVERARNAFARLIHASPEEVALVSTATAGISAVLHALQPQGERREILTIDLDFPTGPFLAERQRARGMMPVHLPTSGGHIAADAWARHVTPRTALASVPVVASFNGYKLDIAAFARDAHEKGAPLLVDAFQAAGTFDIDVKRLDVDFLVTGTYKWLLAPAGTAFLYVKREHHGLVPTTAGWQAAASPYSFDPQGPPAPDARRFQGGGESVIGAVAAAASLDLLHEVGLAHIEAHNAKLIARAQRHAEDRKFEVLTPRDARASILTFRVPDVARALAALERENVIVNSRLGGIRISPHFYNTERDVDRLFEVLDAA